MNNSTSTKIYAKHRLKGKIYVSDDVHNYLAHDKELAPSMVSILLDISYWLIKSGDIEFHESGITCYSRNGEVNITYSGVNAK